MSEQPVFIPSVPGFLAERRDRFLTVLSGPNNSGKSLFLKHIKAGIGPEAYMMGPVRFYHVVHLSTGLQDPRERDNLDNQFRNTFHNQNENHEQNFLDLSRILTGLSDSRRKELLETCGKLLGCSLSMKRVQEDNELSPRYIDMDGQNAALGSTGTRLLLTLLGVCMDERFHTLLIDEPELGLGPKIQSALMSFLSDDAERKRIFPHLRQIFLSTHSHLFLSRRDLGDNYIVSKAQSTFTVRRISDISEFHQLQFNLLGNTLDSMFFPEAIVVVEGKTDHKYLERLIAQQFPNNRITVLLSKASDLKGEVYRLKELFGDLATSPMRSRIFVVADRVHQSGLQPSLEALGLPAQNVVIWGKNGIEYYYPSRILGAMFSSDPAAVVSEIQCNGDVVSAKGINRRKNDLCEAVVAGMRPDDEVADELKRKLLKPLRDAIA